MYFQEVSISTDFIRASSDSSRGESFPGWGLTAADLDLGQSESKASLLRPALRELTTTLKSLAWLKMNAHVELLSSKLRTKIVLPGHQTKAHSTNPLASPTELQSIQIRTSANYYYNKAAACCLSWAVVSQLNGQ
jgi:hypothetical protein